MSDGGFAIAYTHYHDATFLEGAYVTIYNEDGSVRASQFSASQVTGVSELYPDIVELADGNLLVTFSDVTNADVKYSIVSSVDGSPVSNGDIATTADTEDSPQVVALPDGGFLAVWENGDE